MSDQDEAISIECMGAFDARWRAEVSLLALLCPEPVYRWGSIGGDLRIDVPDFSADDTNLIARALCAGFRHGRRICALLSRNLLIESRLWDSGDDREYVVGSIWGPVRLARLFTSSLCIRGERELIARELGRVRRYPRIPE